MVGACDVGGEWCFGTYCHTHSSVRLISWLRWRPMSYACSRPPIHDNLTTSYWDIVSFCWTGGGWHSGTYLHNLSPIWLDSWPRRTPMTYPFSWPPICDDATASHQDIISFWHTQKDTHRWSTGYLYPCKTLTLQQGRSTSWVRVQVDVWTPVGTPLLITSCRFPTIS